MGLLRDLFKTTLGGGSGNDGAYNAHLAELAIEKFDVDEKRRLANEVIAMGVRASMGRVSADHFCDTFNRHNRLCQLNLIALALAKLNICILPNLKWMPINNPFALKITEEEILVSAMYFLKYHKLHVKIKDGKIDIRDWMESIDGHMIQAEVIGHRESKVAVSGPTLPALTKKCKYCAELIKKEAIKCRFCGEFLAEEESVNSRGQDKNDENDLENRILCSDGACIGVLDEDGICKVCGKPGKELHQTSNHDLIKDAQLLSKDSSVPLKGNSTSKRVCRTCDEIIIIRDGVSCPKCGDNNP